MIRLIGFFVGIGFVVSVLWAFATGAYTAATESTEASAEQVFHKAPRALHLASDGPFGTWDHAQLQRGYQVYKEVCAACHGLNHVAIRDLGQLTYSEAEVKAEAANWTVPGIDPNTGEASTRPGLPTDYFPSPYANEVAAAAANNNAIPPDLSLITKARPNGSAYVYSLLTGFQNPPANLPKELQPATGLHYNPYFANLNLAMAPPLTDGQVTFADGSPNDVKAMASDVTAFLVWTAEPKLVQRVRVGWAAFLFLSIFSILAYLSYRNIWADKEH